MPRVAFEPTIRVFERAKTVHALDREATVIGNQTVNEYNSVKIGSQHVCTPLKCMFPFVHCTNTILHSRDEFKGHHSPLN
jgi:hypothetical protein